jgi:hypothetical protein
VKPVQEDRHRTAVLIDLAREVSRLDVENARRRLNHLPPAQVSTVYRIALALGLPWPLEGSFDATASAPAACPEPSMETPS